MPNLIDLATGGAIFSILGAVAGSFLCGLLEDLIATKPSTAPPTFATIAVPTLIGGGTLLIILSFLLSTVTVALTNLSSADGFWSGLGFVIGALFGCLAGFILTVLRYANHH